MKDGNILIVVLSLLTSMVKPMARSRYSLLRPEELGYIGQTHKVEEDEVPVLTCWKSNENPVTGTRNDLAGRFQYVHAEPFCTHVATMRFCKNDSWKVLTIFLRRNILVHGDGQFVHNLR